MGTVKGGGWHCRHGGLAFATTGLHTSLRCPYCVLVAAILIGVCFSQSQAVVQGLGSQCPSKHALPMTLHTALGVFFP